MRLALLLPLAGCFVTGDDAGDRCGGTSCAPGSLVWTTQATSLNTVFVSAVASSPGEPPWFAGHYNQHLVIEDETYGPHQTGINDAFVARVGARERPAVWAGFTGAMFSQHTAGIFPDGEEGAVLITYGDVPGAGWRTDAYVIDRYSNEVQHAVLAAMDGVASTGVAAVATRDGAGWPVVAVSGLNLEVEPDIDGVRAVVLRVLQGLTTEKVFDQVGIEITSIAPDTRETLVIGGHYGGTPPGWPTCPEVRCGFAAIIDARVDAETPVLRLEVFRATLGADVLGVGTNGAGRLVVMGTHEGDAIEPSFVGPDYPSLWLDFGTETEGVSAALSFDPDLDLSGSKLVATDEGAVLALSFIGTIDVDSPDGEPIVSDGVGMHDMVIAEYPAAIDGSGWRLTVRSDGDIQATALAVEGTQVAVGGNFTGLMSISTGTVLDRADTSAGFVFELRR